MPGKPPTPEGKSSVLCRRIIQDAMSGDYVLFAPTHLHVSPVFPCIVPLSFFGRWTSVQGCYELECQLQDLEGNLVWRLKHERPLDCRDPLLVCVLCLHNMQVFLPRPGKFDFVILANGDEVQRDVFFAQLPPPAGTV